MLYEVITREVRARVDQDLLLPALPEDPLPHPFQGPGDPPDRTDPGAEDLPGKEGGEDRGDQDRQSRRVHVVEMPGQKEALEPDQRADREESFYGGGPVRGDRAAGDDLPVEGVELDPDQDEEESYNFV